MSPLENWVPGSVIRVFSKNRGVWHFGITGTVWGTVYHASKELGAFALTDYDQFAWGQDVQYTWFPETAEKRDDVIGRADNLCGKPYRLMAANCEDYVNWIVTGVARSPQRDQAVALAILLGILGGGLGGLF